MNWDDLRIFLAVSRFGTMTNAAKQLNVQHSTVSRRIRALERQLGVSLLVKKKGAFELTDAGRNVQQSAMRMEGEVTSVDGALSGKDARLVGSLTLTTFGDLASNLLMPLLKQFSEQHPAIDMHIRVSNSAASLAQREADIAIRMSNSPTETLIGKRVATVASTLYGTKEYVEQQATIKEPLKWIGVNCCSFHKYWTKQTSGSDMHQFNCDDSVITHSAIKAGMGVSYLPCFLGDADSSLARVCKPDSSHDMGLWVLMHPELKRNARVLAFRQTAIKYLDSLQHKFSGVKYL